MRLYRLAVSILVCGAFLASVGSARAQTEITLGGSSQLVTFKGLGSSNTTQESIDLGHCTGSTCSMTGSAFGTGLVASGPATYSLTSSLGSIVATLVSSVTGQWSVAQSAPILFSYGAGGSLLTGDLNLVSFQETPSSKQGAFNYAEVANLTVTGGSLASLFGSKGVADMLLTFKTGTNVMGLLGTTRSISGQVSSGELLPTPEPSAFAIFLLGSGMLLISALMRRRSSAVTA